MAKDFLDGFDFIEVFEVFGEGVDLDFWFSVYFCFDFCGHFFASLRLKCLKKFLREGDVGVSFLLRFGEEDEGYEDAAVVVHGDL